MAYTRSRRKTSPRTRGGYSRPARRTRTARSRPRKSSRRSTQTIRIVLEQPGSGQAERLPVGMKERAPKVARF